MASNQPRRLLKRPPDQLVDGRNEEYGNPRVLLNQVPDDHRRHDEVECGGHSGDGRLNIYRAGPSYNNDGRGRNSDHGRYPRQYNRPQQQQHQHRTDHGRHKHQQDRSRSREGKSTRQSRESLKRSPDELSHGEEDHRRLPRKIASPYSLQCRPLGDAEEPQELWWRCEVDPIPIATERILVDVLLPNKEREKGMMREKPLSVLRRIKNVCQQHGVDLSTACSLRRHHIKSYNLYKKMSSLRLGDETDINASAAIFEKVVAKFLRQERIAFYGEFEQRAFINENLPKGQPYPVTPDFMLKQPVLLKTYRSKEVTLEDGTKQSREVTQELLIHWIEVKMFYGASTIDRDGKSAVGRILQMAEKYTTYHGAGAIIFMQGFGDALGQQLRETDVVALSCCPAHNFKLKRVTEHQRTWCANDRGEILP